MRNFPTAPFALALPVTLATQMAWADLTPAEVWGDWQGYMQGMGYTVTAEESTNGDTLTVSGINFGMELPDNQGDMAIALGTISFVAQGDGTVEVVLPDTMPMEFDMAMPEGQDGKMSMVINLSQSGHKMIASGTPDEIVSTYTADTLAMSVDQMIADGVNMSGDAMRMVMTASGVANKTTMTGQGDARGYAQEGSITGMSYDMFMAPPDEPASVSMQGQLEALNYSSAGTIPNVLVDASDMSAMIEAGFDVDGTFTYNNGKTAINVEDPQGGGMAINTASTGGSLGFQMGANGLAYNVEQQGATMNAQTPDLPFPIDLSMAKVAFNILVPVTASDVTQDFAIGMTMGDFEMSDMIWGLFDPAGQLPRDPATIALDLTGKAKMLIDFMDPDSAALMATQSPGELEAVTLKNLTVDVAGARLDGTGDFVFDNTDMTTFPGMPKPVGEVNLNLVGGNGLLDTLVAMGLLPQDQAMGARMMMGMFAVPGDAPDTLSSKIEVNDQGHVLANGQRIQ